MAVVDEEDKRTVATIGGWRNDEANTQKFSGGTLAGYRRRVLRYLADPRQQTVVICRQYCAARAARLSSNIADIWLPQGATMDPYSSSKLEMWHANASIGWTTQAMNSLLPVNQPLDGLPWCGSTTGTGSNSTSTYWAWGTSTDKVSVGVADFQGDVMINIGRGAPTSGVCRPGD